MLICVCINRHRAVLKADEEGNQRAKISCDQAEQIASVVHLEAFESEKKSF